MLAQKPFNYLQVQLFRWSMYTILVVAFLLVGAYEVPIKKQLSDYTLTLSNFIHLQEISYALDSILKLHNPTLVNLCYRLLHACICASFISLYFRKKYVTKVTLIFYSLLLLLTFLLYFTAGVTQLSFLRIVAFRIDTLLISPMPIILLFASFRFLRQL